MTWTPEQTAFAIKHWNQGKSAAMVAQIMNETFSTELTRSAIIGRVGRLGHQRAAPAGLRSSTVVKLAKAKAIRKHKVKEQWTPTVREVEKPKPAPAPVIVADVSFARPWMERGSGQCAFPLGERYAVLSCCAPTAETYCKAHRAMMGGTREPWSPKDHRKAARA